MHVKLRLSLMLFCCLVYASTLALADSIAFINLKKSEKEFGYIRVWGTIGSIVAGLTLMRWRFLDKYFESIAIGGDKWPKKG